MVNSSIGELKLFPLKEEGKFVFINDAVKINGKTEKEDNIKIFVTSYSQEGGKIALNIADSSKAIITVRGQKHVHEHLAGYGSLEALYDHVSKLYKDHFYFGDKQ